MQDRIVDSLSCLEYPGYDKASVANRIAEKASIPKAFSKLEDLKSELARLPLAGRLGTRHKHWATFLCKSMNAHPDRAKQVTVVHK